MRSQVPKQKTHERRKKELVSPPQESQDAYQHPSPSPAIPKTPQVETVVKALRGISTALRCPPSSYPLSSASDLALAHHREIRHLLGKTSRRRSSSVILMHDIGSAVAVVMCGRGGSSWG